MKWRKLGKVYENHGIHLKLFSHASNPVAIHVDGDLFRIFFSSRDSSNRSSVGFVDLDIFSLKVESICKFPIFQHGDEGSWFRSGISIGGTYSVNDEDYMLFMAWQNDPGVHWRGDIGRFVIRKSTELSLDPMERPFLSSDGEDPISLSYPWVLRDGNRFQMWYGSTVSWDAGNGEMLHVIKYATSEDGYLWNKRGQVVEHILGFAQAFSRPTVCRDESGYHMWFSFRGAGSKYRIGYAFSADGEEWQADFKGAGIDVSDDGWDSDMIEYPFVFDHKGERYMLYNGNDYGRTGFGLAILEK